MLNPDGELQILDYSNSPFARPDLRILVEGALPRRSMSSLELHSHEISYITSSICTLECGGLHILDSFNLVSALQTWA